MFSKNFLAFSRGGSNENFPRIFEGGSNNSFSKQKIFPHRGRGRNKSWGIIPKFHTFSTKLVYTIRSQKITAQNLIFNCTNFFPNYTLCVWLHVRISPDLQCDLEDFPIPQDLCPETIDHGLPAGKMPRILCIFKKLLIIHLSF